MNKVTGASSSKQDPPKKFVVQVPHVAQWFAWDCGLACVCMVLKTFNISTASVYKEDLEKLQCGESVWTIDLAYLMKQYGLQHKFLTKTIGVDKSYSSKAFYRSTFTEDEKRVNTLFSEAESRGVVVENRSMSMKEIMEHVQEGTIAIVLVDGNHLECIWCDKCNNSFCSPCCLSLLGYQGHFVVLCGYDAEHDHVYYMNPNESRDEMCCSRMRQFDGARKTSGTDEDILLVFKPPEGEERQVS